MQVVWPRKKGWKGLLKKDSLDHSVMIRSRIWQVVSSIKERLTHKWVRRVRCVTKTYKHYSDPKYTDSISTGGIISWERCRVFCYVLKYLPHSLLSSNYFTKRWEKINQPYCQIDQLILDLLLWERSFGIWVFGKPDLKSRNSGPSFCSPLLYYSYLWYPRTRTVRNLFDFLFDFLNNKMCKHSSSAEISLFSLK